MTEYLEMFATSMGKKKLSFLSEAAGIKVYHEALHFTKQKYLSTGWIVVLTALQGSHQVMQVFFFF